MVACAHGDVAAFCEKYGIKILESYDGDLEDYRGNCAVIVTDQQMTREDYETLKCTMFGRGIEVISTEWTDDAIILALLRQTIERRKRRGGRNPFGYRKENGVIVEIPEMMAVARRVIEMREAGHTLKGIRADKNVRHTDGRKISMSTIQTIIKNKEKYEKKV